MNPDWKKKILFWIVCFNCLGFIFSSCTHQYVSPDKSKLNKLTSSSHGLNQGVEIPYAQKSVVETTIIDDEDKLLPNILLSSGSSKNTQAISNGNNKMSAIYFRPGMYTTAGNIGLLKALEKLNKIPNIYSGNGFGLLVASMFAKEQKASVVEWYFFKLMQRLSKVETIYSSEWKQVLRNFISEYFQDITIQELALPLICPLFNIKENKMVFLDRGKLASILEMALGIEENKSQYWKSSIGIEQLPLDKFKQLGVRMTYIVNSSSHRASFCSKVDPVLIDQYDKIYLEIKEKGNLKVINLENSYNDCFDTLEGQEGMLRQSEQYVLKNKKSFF